MTAQRLVVQTQHDPLILFEQAPRLAKRLLADLPDPSARAKRVLILIVIAGRLPGARHLGREPTTPVSTQPVLGSLGG